MLSRRNSAVLVALALCGCDPVHTASGNNGAGSANSTTADVAASVSGAPATLQVGRYVIVHSPQVERDTILLDTATGATWSRVSLADVKDEPSAWDPMPKTDDADAMAALKLDHGLKKTTPASANRTAPEPAPAPATGSTN